MATRTLLFFMPPQEFGETLSSAAGAIGFYIFQRRWDSESRRIHISRVLDTCEDISGHQINTPTTLYLSKADLPQKEIIVEDVIPAKNGWLQLDAPLIVEEALLLSDLGVKTDWYEAGSMKVFENLETIKFYEQVRRRFKKALKLGLWCRDDARTWCRYSKKYYYSTGVEEWCNRGGGLRQFGCKYGFSINSPCN